MLIIISLIAKPTLSHIIQRIDLDKINFRGLISTKLSDKSTYWILSHKNVGYETIYTEMSHPTKIFS